MVLLVAEVEAHDEVVEWLDGLNQSDWHRTSVVIDRLASVGSQARMPFSRSLGEGLFEVRFTLDKRGTATCKVHGDVGNLLGARATKPEGSVERCRWWLYQSSGDDTAVVEQWGADYRVLRGKKVAGDTIDLIPGS